MTDFAGHRPSPCYRDSHNGFHLGQSGLQDSVIRSESELRLAVIESIVEPVVDQLVIFDVDLTVADLADSLT